MKKNQGYHRMLRHELGDKSCNWLTADSNVVEQSTTICRKKKTNVSSPAAKVTACWLTQ